MTSKELEPRPDARVEDTPEVVNSNQLTEIDLYNFHSIYHGLFRVPYNYEADHGIWSQLAKYKWVLEQYSDKESRRRIEQLHPYFGPRQASLDSQQKPPDTYATIAYPWADNGIDNSLVKSVKENRGQGDFFVYEEAGSIWLVENQSLAKRRRDVVDLASSGDWVKLDSKIVKKTIGARIVASALSSLAGAATWLVMRPNIYTQPDVPTITSQIGTALAGWFIGGKTTKTIQSRHTPQIAPDLIDKFNGLNAGDENARATETSRVQIGELDNFFTQERHYVFNDYGISKLVDMRNLFWAIINYNVSSSSETAAISEALADISQLQAEQSAWSSQADNFVTKESANKKVSVVGKAIRERIKLLEVQMAAIRKGDAESLEKLKREALLAKGTEATREVVRQFNDTAETYDPSLKTEISGINRVAAYLAENIIEKEGYDSAETHDAVLNNLLPIVKSFTDVIGNPAPGQSEKDILHATYEKLVEVMRSKSEVAKNGNAIGKLSSLVFKSVKQETPPNFTFDDFCKMIYAEPSKILEQGNEVKDGQWPVLPSSQEMKVGELDGVANPNDLR